MQAAGIWRVFLFERTRILVEKKNIRPLWFWVKIIVLELSGNLVEKKKGSRKEDSFLQTYYRLDSLYILINSVFIIL